METSYTSGGLFYTGPGNCYYPHTRSDCLSKETDPLKNSDLTSCGICPNSCTNDFTCIECGSSCNDLCETFADPSKCINMAVVCNPGTYDVSNAQCNWTITCISNCTTCLNSLECLYCQSGFDLQPDLSCGSGCPLGYTSIGLVCTPCHSDCASCVGPSESECSECSDTIKDLDNGQCLCPTNYFPDSGSCTQCHTDCASCNGPSDSQCSECSDPIKVLNSGQCVCPTNYFLDSGSCTQCHPDCASCNGPSDSQCSTCSDSSMSFNSGQCVCPTSYFSESGTCTLCHSDCVSCTGPSDSQCLTCYDPTKTSNNGSCECRINYFPDSGSCTQCHPDCASCNGPSKSDCLTCADNTKTAINRSCECPLNYFPNPESCTQCYSDCATCDGTGQADCLSCLDPLKHIQDQRCECIQGYYSDNNNTCLACHADCETCNGPLNTQCTSCTDSTNNLEQGSCVCLQGYFKNTSGSCESCEGTLQSECNDCEENWTFNGMSCECAEGFYLSSENTCEECDSLCKTCSGPSSSDCLECSNPDLSPEDDCACEKGYYFEDTCKSCGSDCAWCENGEECLECSDSRREVVEGECVCKEGYCVDQGKCLDCEAIPSETDLTSEGKIGAGTLGGSLALGFVSMLTLEDPTVIWTITNIAQIICYLAILDLPISGGFFQFLLSYQTVGFLPNLFLDIEDDSYAPAEYQKFGYLKKEYRDTNFLKNSGRYLELILIVLVAFLIMHVISKVLPESLKEKLRKLTSRWVSSALKIVLTVFLDLCVVASVIILERPGQTTIVSQQMCILFSAILLCTPIALVAFAMYKERIKSKDTSITNYIGSVYSGLNLESDYSFYYEFFLSLRRLSYSISLFFYRKEPLVVLIILCCFSVFFAIYIICGKIYESKTKAVINCLSEIVLCLSLIGLILISLRGESGEIENMIMGINIFFILLASLSNIIVSAIDRLCEKKKKKKIQSTTPIVKLSPFDKEELFSASKRDIICNSGDEERRNFKENNFLTPSINNNIDNTVVSPIQLILDRKRISDNVIYINDAD